MHSKNHFEKVQELYLRAVQGLNSSMLEYPESLDWYWHIDNLPETLKTVYLATVVENQVMNGGFEQYYDNDYGIFAEETLKGLKKIGAELTHELLKTSLDILKKHNKTQSDLFEFITESKYWDNKEIEQVLDRLDDQYYNLEDKEDLTELLGNYLRNSEIDDE
jgi:uncharacterized protein YdiU (UPF0061 family)